MHTLSTTRFGIARKKQALIVSTVIIFSYALYPQTALGQEGRKCLMEALEEIRVAINLRTMVGGADPSKGPFKNECQGSPAITCTYVDLKAGANAPANIQATYYKLRDCFGKGATSTKKDALGSLQTTWFTRQRETCMLGDAEDWGDYWTVQASCSPRTELIFR